MMLATNQGQTDSVAGSGPPSASSGLVLATEQDTEHTPPPPPLGTMPRDDMPGSKQPPTDMSGMMLATNQGDSVPGSGLPAASGDLVLATVQTKPDSTHPFEPHTETGTRDDSTPAGRPFRSFCQALRQTFSYPCRVCCDFSQTRARRAIDAAAENMQYVSSQQPAETSAMS